MLDPSDSVLLKEDILGYKLCTLEEYKALQRAHEIGGPNGMLPSLNCTSRPRNLNPPAPDSYPTGPGNTVLVWLSMLLDKGVNMDKHYFRDNIDQSRMTALNLNFQTKLEALRAAIAKVRARSYTRART